MSQEFRRIALAHQLIAPRPADPAPPPPATSPMEIDSTDIRCRSEPDA